MPLRIEVVPEPQWGAARIVIYPTRDATLARVRRLADGQTAVVRGAESLNVLTGAVIFDTEFPFGSDVTYWAESVTPVGVVSDPVIYHDDGDPCRMMISDPTLPLLSRWFQVTERATLSTEARQDSVAIIGSRVPTAVTDVRSGYADSTQVLITSAADLRGLRQLLRSGRPLVLRYPGEWLEPMVYAAVGAVVENRVAAPRPGVNVGPDPVRTVDLEWIEVSAPRGTIVQRIGLTYRQLRDDTPVTESAPITYRQIRLHKASYLDLLTNGVDW